METWILTENETLSGNLHDALAHSGIVCPEERILDLASLPEWKDVLKQAQGVLFVVVQRFGKDHCNLVRYLRNVVDRDTTIAIASASTDDMAVVQAVRVGANDFLALNEWLTDEVVSFLGRLRESQRQDGDEGTVVTVIPCQSASDASLTTLNLSGVFSMLEGSCMVCDMHFRGSDLALRLKLDHRHNVVDLLTQADVIDEGMLRQVLVEHASGISLLPGPDLFADLAGIQMPLCRDVVALARSCWPIVTVNTESVYQARQVGVLGMSDVVVLAIRLDIASVHRAKQAITMLLESNVPRASIHIVAVGAGIAGELPANSVKKILQVDNFHCVPEDQEAVVKSTNIGNPLVFEQPNCKTAKAFRACAESLLGIEAPAKTSTLPLSGLRAASFLAISALMLCS